MVTMVCVVACLAAFGQDRFVSSKHSPADEKVLALHEDFREALIRENVPALEKIFADEFVFIGSNGKKWPKKQMVDLLRGDVLDHHAIQCGDIEIRSNDKAAILTCTWTARATWNEGNTSTKRDGLHACTFVYLNKDGQWQMVAAHFSPLEQ